jgi:hypothetical protein
MSTTLPEFDLADLPESGSVLILGTPPGWECMWSQCPMASFAQRIASTKKHRRVITFHRTCTREQQEAVVCAQASLERCKVPELPGLLSEHFPRGVLHEILAYLGLQDAVTVVLDAVVANSNVEEWHAIRTTQLCAREWNVLYLECQRLWTHCVGVLLPDVLFVWTMVPESVRERFGLQQFGDSDGIVGGFFVFDFARKWKGKFTVV